jgi:diadenosine tetraphosphate (Ap4A) HIT family hydrolase|tara:strand:- start:3855 stop:4067 length:213 start_codon:yes stop_codon:yes gene_type:complete
METKPKKKEQFSVPVDNYDLLTAKASQLRALLILISGPGYENFTELSPEDQDRILWLATELSNEVHILLK